MGDLWPQGIGREMKLSSMSFGEVWTWGMKLTSRQLLIATNDLGSQDSRLKLGISAISTSDNRAGYRPRNNGDRFSMSTRSISCH